VTDTGRRVVVGVGNPFRGDDGVGIAVARAARGRLPREVEVVCACGEPARLLDLWDGADLAVVVDALRRDGGVPGSVQVVDLASAAAATSLRTSHGLGVADALRLGAVLERLPGRVAVVGVDVGVVTAGPGLSPAVTAAVPRAADAVVRLVRLAG
jgi:hydrogenase maturation protease